MKMTIVKAALILALACSGTASASLLYDYTGPSVAIPDNSASGSAFAFSFSDPATSISSLTVSFNISGGHNGDLYAYLSHGSGFAVLLNRAGVGQSTSGSSALGYANPGFAITLSSAGSANVHFYQNNSPAYNGSGQLIGTWQPDGRGIDPESAPSAFDAGGSANFGSFTGLNPNGDWTLFISDMSAGAVSTLNSFSVEVIAPVPEPVNVALGIFGCLLVGCYCLRNRGAWKSFPRLDGLASRLKNSR